MTLRLAIDDTDRSDLPDGLIVAINPTLAGLNDALTALGRDPTDYTLANMRVHEIDETHPTKWDRQCRPGWYLIGGNVTSSRSLSFAEQVVEDISLFQAAVDRESEDLELVIAKETFSPHTDSGHAWSDDLLHSLIKPNIRALTLGLAAAKLDPTVQTMSAYANGLTRFLVVANDVGLVGLYDNADKSVWRPKRTGVYAYGYDADTGGVALTAGNAEIRAAVAYPEGETVATWDALAAAGESVMHVKILSTRGLKSVETIATKDIVRGEIVDMGMSVGFALHDAATNERVSVCVECNLTELNISKGTHKGGDIFKWNAGQSRAAKATIKQIREHDDIVGVLHEDVDMKNHGKAHVIWRSIP